MERLKDSLTKSIYNREIKKGFPQDLVKISLRKLFFVLSRASLEDFKIPPSNNLEKLQGDGDGDGQYSIRINDKYRVCFEWDGNKAINIEIVNYHK